MRIYKYVLLYKRLLIYTSNRENSAHTRGHMHGTRKYVFQEPMPLIISVHFYRTLLLNI